ncbi:MAG: sialidase family protein [Phycisphaerales bacterium]
MQLLRYTILLIIMSGFCSAVPIIVNDQPASDFSDFYAWYRADDGVLEADGSTAENNDSVAKWINHLGNSNRDLDVIVGTSGTNPTFKADIINSKPAVRFNNSKGIQSPEARFGVLSQPVTIFIVCQQNSNVTDYIFDSANINSRNLLASNLVGSERLWAINGGLQFYSSPVVYNKFLLHTIVFNGSDSTHYINGKLAAAASGGVKSLGGLTLGIHAGLSGNALEGYISEMLIYSNALSASDRSNIEKYLLEKYALDYECGYDVVGYPVVDLNKDCKIDFGDFAVLAEYWLVCTDPKNPECAPYSILVPDKTDVFWQGMDGIHTYRIPSMNVSPNGTILAFAEARKISSADLSPTKIVLRRSSDQGKTWQPATTLIDVGDDAACDPTTVVDKETGRVWLFYEVFPSTWLTNPVPGLAYPSCLTYTMFSDDDGASWSSPIDLSPQIKSPAWYGLVSGPGIGIQLEQGVNKGRLVIPAHNSSGNFIYYSDDHGATWQRSPGMITDLPKGIECQIAELSNGNIRMDIRSAYEEAGYRKFSITSDYGINWTPVQIETELIEPHCMASLLSYKTGNSSILLFSNPADLNQRIKLTIKASYDDGQNWNVSKLLNSGPSGYSSLTVLKDNSVGCLFENGSLSFSSEKISFSRFNYSWLTSN